MFYLKLTWILFLVVKTKCSKVSDSINQQGIYTSDYCPVSKYCPEGTHVLCLYHDSAINKMRLGPKCGRGAKLLTMTDELADWILSLVNQFRIKVALGEETGKKNYPLPKGYGLKRVKWDNELATLAQLWANQCSMQYDMCHATKRFPEPGQLLGIKRFSYPDYQKLINGSIIPKDIYEPGVTVSKAVDAVTAIFRLVQHSKTEVTTHAIRNYSEVLFYVNNFGPTNETVEWACCWYYYRWVNIVGFREYNQDATVYTTRNYLEIISNWTTHVGCGMVAYTQYVSRLMNQKQGLVNVIQLVCNFAGKPTEGRPVYETVPPKNESYTPECGCPPGYYEDADCLCNEGSRHFNGRDKETMTLTCSNREPDCKPSVVLLPIFNIEDAPPDKLYNPGKIGEYRRETIRDVKKRYFNNAITQPRYRKGGSSTDGGGHVSANMSSSSRTRDSIFTKVSKFQLPVQHKHRYIKGLLADNYTVNEKTNKTVTDDTSREDSKYKEEIMHSIVPKSQNNLQDVSISVTNRHFDIKNSSEENTQLLNLLDNLEEKVKYSELNSSAKEIVDAKIRKIYEHVVGDSDRLLISKGTKNPHRLNDDRDKKSRKSKIQLIDRENMPFSSEDEHTIIGSRTPAITRTFKDSQESFNLYVKPRFGRYKTKHHIFDRDDTDFTGPLKRSQESFKLNDKARFAQFKTKHGMYDTDDEDLTRPLKGSQESLKLYNKPRFERIKTKHSLSSVSNMPIFDTDDRDDDNRDDYFKDIHDFNNNNNDDGYESVNTLRNRNYYSDDEDETSRDERRKYYQKRRNKMMRKRNRNSGYRYRNEWYNDHYDRPVITPHDDLEKPYLRKRTLIRRF